MSWGSGTSGGAAAGGAGGAAGGASGAASSAGANGVSLSSANAAPATSGWSAGIDSVQPNQSGPTVGNATDLSNGTNNTYNSQLARGLENQNTYGTANPSIMDKGFNSLERFQKGQNQSLPEAYKSFGNNPETYGAAYGMLNKLSGMGKQSGAAPITINSSYQQPENTYLKRYARG